MTNVKSFIIKPFKKSLVAEPSETRLLSTEELKLYAVKLSREHVTGTRPGNGRILKQLFLHEKNIKKTVEQLQTCVRSGENLWPAGKWLLDNFYLIEEQIILARKYLPKSYARTLPVLENLIYKDYPRIYVLAEEFLSHCDCFLSIENLVAFFEAYQKEVYLTLRELWALPNMLRIVIIKKLSTLSKSIEQDIRAAEESEFWAARILKQSETSPAQVIQILADLAQFSNTLSDTFYAEFLRRIQNKIHNIPLVYTWLEHNLNLKGQNINSLLLSENQKKSADQASVSNSILSLRLISKLDWRNIVEKLSRVEKILRQDPAGIYSRMDFDTRNIYRNQIEKFSRKWRCEEERIAQIAIKLAKETNPKDILTTHVGFYLFKDRGQLALRAYFGKNKLFNQMTSSLKALRAHTYIFIFLILSLLSSATVLISKIHEYFTTGTFVIFFVVLLLIATNFTQSVINIFFPLVVKPRPLPRLDFSKGIPENARTLVVVPCLLASKEHILQLTEDLELRFLANNQKNIYFALLSDFKDAPVEKTPNDNELLEFAAKCLKELNVKYGFESGHKFFLFHRPRLWNPVQRSWMGYERKRGKLHDLNKLLRGNSEAFMYILGDKKIFTTIKYVLTLDADTQLPRDTVHKLVGVAEHPLNKPQRDFKRNIVTDGYAIIQPRISMSITGKKRTLYTRLFESDQGIDPYTKVVSDLYFDLFDEASYIGKGLYDVDTFISVLEQRFPENRILSHDLLEGSYLRCAYASDVILFEEYPSNYENDIARKHRWIRGDWQAGLWIFPYVINAKRKWVMNPISLIARWKIFDNLRRSLLPPSILFFLLILWLLKIPLLKISLWFLILFVAPASLQFGRDVFNKSPESSWKFHLLGHFRILLKNLIQAGFFLLCLPYEAWLSAHAISITLWRLVITKRNLLEWNPFGLVSFKSRTISRSYKRLKVQPLFSISLAVIILYFNPGAFISVLPWLILWCLMPFVTWWLNKAEKDAPSQELKSAHIHELRRHARKIWGYFENEVSEKTNWLPPDNVQLYPQNITAKRTSPTNIGLYALSVLSAYEFGYITLKELIHRLYFLFQSLEKLEKYQGHLYNWYNTETLEVLKPRYISTVDTGNFVAHLRILHQGLLELKDARFFDVRLAQGALDTLHILADYANDNGLISKEWLKNVKLKIHHEAHHLLSLSNFIKDIIKTLHQQPLEDIKQSPEAYFWYDRTIQNFNGFLEELNATFPWIDLLKSDFQYFKHLILHFSRYSLSEWIKIKENPSYINFLDNESNLTEEQKQQLRELLYKTASQANSLYEKLSFVIKNIDNYINPDFSFLYDPEQKLLSIGYNTELHTKDSVYYDLLASEARLTIYLAIAANEIPQESWFSLGRRVTTFKNRITLLSWSGSMFEYLMPELIMPSFPGTLLYESNHGCILRHIEYALEKNIPWGISESCYNFLDSNQIYQYKAFGVPGLGFKRDLGQDLVVAPYATFLALPIFPLKAFKNLNHMKTLGYEGKYGFYEAIDFTPSRLSQNRKEAIVKTFMAHHIGMSFIALSNVILGPRHKVRFERDLQLRSALPLLQERVPRVSGFYKEPSMDTSYSEFKFKKLYESENLKNKTLGVPRVQIFFNGKLQSVISENGSGYLNYKGLNINRWREDPTKDNYGNFIYIKDHETNEFWTISKQPMTSLNVKFTHDLSFGKAWFGSKYKDVESEMQVYLSYEDDIEIRRIKLTNYGSKTLRLQITSYQEVTLAPLASDMHHPIFNGLFIETKAIKDQQSLLCYRRPKSPHDLQYSVFQSLVPVSGSWHNFTYDARRSNFLGRKRNISEPLALISDYQLKEETGFVLDPAITLRMEVVLESGESAVLDIVSGVAETPYEAENLCRKYKDVSLRNRVLDLQWVHHQLILQQLQMTEQEAEIFYLLASSVIFSNEDLRAESHLIVQNSKGQSSLWSYAVSGDYPIILLRLSSIDGLELARQLLKALTFFDLIGLQVDLFILNEDVSYYRQELFHELNNLVTSMARGFLTSERQKIFVRQAHTMPFEDQILLQAVARVTISDKEGTLANQILKSKKKREQIDLKNYTKKPNKTLFADHELSLPETLSFYNGWGGFKENGSTYVLNVHKNKPTPQPWSNIISNGQFGTLITETGAGFTWYENSYAFRITPWSNDPLTDPIHEVIYLRDEETGQFWSLTPSPAPSASNYLCSHGLGYTIFEHHAQEIKTQLTLSIDPENPVKYYVVKAKNTSKEIRKVSLIGYVEWCLGPFRPMTYAHIITEVDPQKGTILAHNPFNSEMPERWAFFSCSEKLNSFTCDRLEFLGRNGSTEKPAGLKKEFLSGKSGAGMDACGALMTTFTLRPDEERTVYFRLGAALNKELLKELIKTTQEAPSIERSIQKQKDFWLNFNSKIQIETPDNALNCLFNNWLLYQVLSSRVWGRSGYYQPGGAFGFRDQLQDVLSLVYSQPSITRHHILLAASRQFREGDVQHWWHLPMGRGVRTRCSDDLLWLPYAVSKYVEITEDYIILDELIPYLEGRPLNESEESYYDAPLTSHVAASLYEHCRIALERSFRLGKHGLPLIGSGDWNDGMNLVGIKGEGESIWLAFFLYDVLQKFIPIVRYKKDEEFEKKCKEIMDVLKDNVNREGWDGAWFRRAYFDDGTPLGSALNDECKIDSLSQSWSVISGAGESEKSRLAVQNAYRFLIDKENKLIKLLSPPFNASQFNPGYIKGYAPGIRENGGQYTHAAVWLAIALAKLKDQEKVEELLHMLNPIWHTCNDDQVKKYQTEPYVLAGDVYSLASYEGKGGWTWYTGAASWFYMFVLEYVLGLKIYKDKLVIEPCPPASWNEFKVYLKKGTSAYIIKFKRKSGISTNPIFILDGNQLVNSEISLYDDGKEHEIIVLYS